MNCCLILFWLKHVSAVVSSYWYPYHELIIVPQGMTYSYISRDLHSYYVNLEVGTPSVYHKFILDTTVSHSLINVDALNWEKFNQSNSTTFWECENQAKYNIKVNFITKARGRFGSDLVSFRRKPYRLALGLTTEGTHPQLFGLGPKMNSTSFSCLNESAEGHQEPTYHHFLEALKHDGVILRESFSLWLAGAGEKCALLFGGLDRMAFKGDMHVVPMVDANPYQLDSFSRKLGVMLDSIVGEDSFYLHVGVPVLLDVSSPVSYLPENVVEHLLYRYFQPNEKGVLWSYAEILWFDFGGFQLPIRTHELIFFCPVDAACNFAFRKKSHPPYTLGSAILESFYMVFDYENYTVGLAVAQKPGNVHRHSLIVIRTGIPTKFYAAE